MLRLVLVVSLLVALSACGGHPATPAPDSPNPARGLYVSTYFYSQPTLIVLPDGRFFLPFRTLTTYGSQISGLGAGHGIATANSFTGTYQYFGALASHPGTINATFTPGDSLTGILLDGGSTSTIHGYVLPPDQYNMDTVADPLKFSGYWLAGMPGCGLDLKVTKAGTINGSHVSTDTCICDLAGTFSPDSVSNFFHVQLTFPQDDCPLHGSATGFALAYTDRSPSLAPIDKILIVVSGADGDSTIITGIQDPSNFSKP